LIAAGVEAEQESPGRARGRGYARPFATCDRPGLTTVGRYAPDPAYCPSVEVDGVIESPHSSVRNRLHARQWDGFSTIQRVLLECLVRVECDPPAVRREERTVASLRTGYRERSTIGFALTARWAPPAGAIVFVLGVPLATLSRR
jgi:hypothetical protein